MLQFKARNHEGIYDELGINLNTLGCVMLDLEFQTTSGFWERYAADYGLVPYVSSDPEQHWINGITTDHHVTLRYGLMPEVKPHHCDEVLRNNQIEDVFDYAYDFLDRELGDDGIYILPYRLSTFEGFNGEYFVLVMEVDMEQENYILPRYIQNCHNALALLPNLATFSPPTFHMTLGYFHSPEGDELPSFANISGNTRVEIKGIRYGRSMRA